MQLKGVLVVGPAPRAASQVSSASSLPPEDAPRLVFDAMRGIVGVDAPQLLLPETREELRLTFVPLHRVPAVPEGVAVEQEATDEPRYGSRDWG